MLDGAVPDEELKRLSRGMKELSYVSAENKEKNIRFKTERETRNKSIFSLKLLVFQEKVMFIEKKH